MNREELLKKFNNLKGAHAVKLEEAGEALEDGDLETAKGLREEAAGLMDEIKLYKAQIDDLDEAEGLQVDDKEKEQDPTPSTKNRLPMGDEPEEEDPEDANDYFKTVYTSKYGEEEAAVKAVVKDMHGSVRNYHEARFLQNAAFAKYLRRGYEVLNSKEAGLLQTLVYNPNTIMDEVRSGVPVSEMKRTKATQLEGILEMGGFLVPEDTRLEIIRRVAGMTIVRQNGARIVETVRDRIDWPRLEGGNSRYTSGVRVTWIGEEPSSATTAETNFTVGSVGVPVNIALARTNVSRSLLEDAGVDVAMLVSELFSEAMAQDEDEQFLLGEGGDRPEGVLGVRSGANAAPVSGISTVNSGNATALTADGLIDLAFDLDAQYLQNAVFVGAKATFRDIRKLKDGNGDYLWQRGLEQGSPPTVLGYNYLMQEAMPSVGASNHPLIFGDWRGYLIAERVGMTVERIVDATTAGQNQIALFGRRRVGGSVAEPWRFRAHKIST